MVETKGAPTRTLIVEKQPHSTSGVGAPSSNPQSNNFYSIQAAVFEAHEGDTIKISPGLYEETIYVE